MPAVAIACEGVWKSYRIYHQRSHTLKEKVLSRRNMYEDFWALRGVDLEVPEAATFGIIGANGSGKSTLLKTMARILTPNRGSVTVNGTVSPLLELGTGFHPELTGRENVFLAGSLLGRSRADVTREYDAIVEFAGIEAFMDSPVKNYSSGMYARLAFAVAISVDPEILIVDEVLSVGDEAFQLRCYERVAKLRAEGRTVVIVTHGLETIKSLCSEAAWIDEGVVRECGRALDVVTTYLKDVHGDSRYDHDWSHTGNRFGSGEAEIVDLAFLDGDGFPAPVYRTGQTMAVRIAYRAAGPLADDVSCGIAVYRADNGSYLFGQNSREAGVELGLQGSGTITFTVPELPLLQGSYTVTVALHEMGKKIYDFHDRRYSFLVVQDPGAPEEAGMVHVESSWTVTQDPVPVR
jgi:ABC-type polysaccharide/polyol phosphate transport system ATPase subunit